MFSITVQLLAFFFFKKLHHKVKQVDAIKIYISTQYAKSDQVFLCSSIQSTVSINSVNKQTGTDQTV